MLDWKVNCNAVHPDLSSNLKKGSNYSGLAELMTQNLFSQIKHIPWNHLFLPPHSKGYVWFMKRSFGTSVQLVSSNCYLFWDLKTDLSDCTHFHFSFQQNFSKVLEICFNTLASTFFDNGVFPLAYQYDKWLNFFTVTMSKYSFDCTSVLAMK